MYNYKIVEKGNVVDSGIVNYIVEVDDVMCERMGVKGGDDFVFWMGGDGMKSLIKWGGFGEFVWKGKDVDLFVVIV